MRMSSVPDISVLCLPIGLIGWDRPLLSVGLVILFVVGSYAGVSLYRVYLGVSLRHAAQLWFGALAAALLWFWLVGGEMRFAGGVGLAQFLMHLARVLALVPLGSRLYMKWVMGTTTAAERATGMEGIQAWLGGGNLVAVLVLSVANSMTFLYPFLQTLVMGLLALTAYPLLNTLFHFTDPRGGREGRDAGRSRVLSLLEQGRINAEECAVLLRELDSRGRKEQNPPHAWFDLEQPGRLALVAALLVALGFLVSWVLR